MHGPSNTPQTSVLRTVSFIFRAYSSVVEAVSPRGGHPEIFGNVLSTSLATCDWYALRDPNVQQDLVLRDLRDA